MNKTKLWMFAAILIICGMTMVSCFSRSKKFTIDVPVAPDYQDSTQWYIINRQAAADIFYIISTETGDYSLPSGEICHWYHDYRR